jgi:uncharacterized RDD family membrane protein YckC
MERVGFHPRAAAFLIDLLLFAIVAHLVAVIELNLFQSGSWHLFGVLTMGAAWMTLVLLGLLEAVRGTSFGKKFMRIELAGADGRPAPASARLIRTLFKFAPVILVPGGCVAYGVAVQWGLPTDLQNAFAGIFWADVVVATGLTVFIIVGCFRALRSDHQAYHDLAAGTAVFWTTELRAARGFVPVIARAATTEEMRAAGPVAGVAPSDINR